MTKEQYLNQIKTILDTASADPELEISGYKALCDEVGDEAIDRYDMIDEEEQDEYHDEEEDD